MKQELLNNKASTLHSISQFRKEINDRLDELEKETVDDAVTRFNGTKLDNKMKKCEALKTSLVSIKDNIKTNRENKFQKFVTVTKDMTRQAIKDIHASPVLTNDICLNLDHNLLSMLKKIDSLGTFGQKEQKAILGVGKSDILCIKVDSDEEDCSITSACELHNWTVILSDAGK
jgi:hypothetical protein